MNAEKLVEATTWAVWDSNFHPYAVASGEAARRVADWPKDWAKAEKQARAALAVALPMLASDLLVSHVVLDNDDRIRIRDWRDDLAEDIAKQ